MEIDKWRNETHQQLSTGSENKQKIGRQLMEIEKWRKETDQKLEAVFNMTHEINRETDLPIDSFVSQAVLWI